MLLKKIVLFALLLSTQSIIAQDAIVTGTLKDKIQKTPLSYVNIILKTEKDSAFVSGTISDEEGLFTLSNIAEGKYFLEISFIGYKTLQQSFFVGNLNNFLNLGTISLEEDTETLTEVLVTATQDEVSSKMDKKTFSVDDNISQSGGSILQSMQNLPGVTTQDGKVQLRGNDKVTILVDGKQTALTGYGNQGNLDNIPASAIERIEIINNPSAKYDANGNAGIINIIFKKEKQEGFNGKVGLSLGLGALWIKRENLPTIRPQYQFTPKINPSLSLNYRKNKINFFVQGDYLYTHTLNKNEFVTRTYDTGEIIQQQTKRNRNTSFITAKAGLDWNMDEQNTFSVSALFSSEKILDFGDQPFFNADLSERQRLWTFLEDELKTTATAFLSYQHKFKAPGQVLNVRLNYTFHREDEQYYFENSLPTYTGLDSFKLISDEHVADLNIDYIHPLKHGRIEAGFKFRRRDIPTNMLFIPGLNSPLDTNAGGWATYKETIPSIYGNYVFESKKIEVELGLIVEYVGLQYDVNPNHNTYKSDGYFYIQPFPNARLAYKINNLNKISMFYNRRVDRPNEIDIRIFPKYDDAEIVKIGNPALRPQYTHLFELAYKTSWNSGYYYASAYFRMADGTITRIASTLPNNTLIYSIMQNAGKSYNAGLEMVLSQKVAKWFSLNLNLNGYYNQIEAFSVENKYPVTHTFSAASQQIFSGSAKLNTMFHFFDRLDIQLTAIYLAPDIIPQGKIGSRFSLDLGFKLSIQKGKGSLFLNATDLLNTMQINTEIQGTGFQYTSINYYETQVVRLGYSYKF